MSRHICPMLDRFIHLEAIVLHCLKVLHVLEHNAFPIDPRLALELHVGLLPAMFVLHSRRVERQPFRPHAPPRSTLLFVPPLPKRFATTVSIKRN